MTQLCSVGLDELRAGDVIVEWWWPDGTPVMFYDSVTRAGGLVISVDMDPPDLASARVVFLDSRSGSPILWRLQRGETFEVIRSGNVL